MVSPYQTFVAHSLFLYKEDIYMGLLGFPSCIFLVFFYSYIKYDLRKNKIVVSFFCQLINFYELIIRF